MRSSRLRLATNTWLLYAAGGRQAEARLAVALRSWTHGGLIAALGVWRANALPFAKQARRIASAVKAWGGASPRAADPCWRSTMGGEDFSRGDDYGKQKGQKKANPV